MAAFVYLCPRTGLKVQGWTDDEPTHADIPMSVDCAICKSIHAVNPIFTNGPNKRSDQGRSPMTMHSDNKGHGLANNFWVQMGLLVVAVVVLIALAGDVRL